MARGKTKNSSTGANIGYEAQLWQMADALRGSMDAAEYPADTILWVLVETQDARCRWSTRCSSAPLARRLTPDTGDALTMDNRSSDDQPTPPPAPTPAAATWACP